MPANPICVAIDTPDLDHAVALAKALKPHVGWAKVGMEFFYAHEGIDLVWRVWDEGYVPWYAADLVANHPVIDPARQEDKARVWFGASVIGLLAGAVAARAATRIRS